MFTELLLNANMRSMSSFLRDNSFDDFCFLSASRSVVGVSYCSLIYVCINNLYRNCSTCFPPDCVCVCFYVIVFLCVCRLQTADQYFNPLENATVLFDVLLVIMVLHQLYFVFTIRRIKTTLIHTCFVQWLILDWLLCCVCVNVLKNRWIFCFCSCFTLGRTTCSLSGTC